MVIYFLNFVQFLVKFLIYIVTIYFKIFKKNYSTNKNLLNISK